MATETVRITPATHERLKELSRQAGAPMTMVISDAVDLLFRQRFLESCNAAYAQLKADPKAWKQELEERGAWDGANLDGLKDA